MKYIFSILVVLMAFKFIFYSPETPRTIGTNTNTEEKRKSDLLEFGLLAPHSLMENKILGDWGNEWWKWAYSFSDENSPIRDTTGKLSTLGQHGNIWFLAGSYSTNPIKREVIIPLGKSIFFPIINSITTIEDGGTCKETIEDVNNNFNGQNLYIEINGVELNNVQQHFEISQSCFSPFSNQNKTHISLGYWIAITSLPIGEHILKFGGTIGNFKQDITYKITIVDKTSESLDIK